MNREELELLRAELRRRAPRPEELWRLEQWLREHPEQREDWGLELALTEQLRRLPDHALPSRVVEQVWQRMDAEEQVARREATGWLAVFVRAGWVRWAAGAGLAAALMWMWWGPGLGSQGLDPQVVAAWQEFAAVPEVWVDFDAVARLPAGPAPDVELLTLLQ